MRPLASPVLLPAALLLAAACGPALDAEPPGFDVELVVKQALVDKLSAFQVALVTNVSTVAGGDCTVIRQTCIRDQLPLDRFVPLRTPGSNRTDPARIFPIALVAGIPSTQDVSLTEVPPGRDYGLIVEAISKDGARLAGADCAFVRQLNAGDNPRVLVRIQQYDPPKPCDPRLAQ
ncbi:MAG: hypothetical protein INH41_21745 [Myxococcaceae bacterium]|nr:hypothetical protein [Myxococcaceae bacterium]MCA3015019.1 hypothetical protein [Myxococcaceae bacterium]